MREQPSMAGARSPAGVSTDERRTRSQRSGRVRVAVVDYGVQALDPAPARGRAAPRSTVFPHDVDADTLAGYDGVLLSNGPGDPEPLVDEVATRAASCSAACRCSASASATSCSRSRPGCETFKLPFGHRGANHPVLERAHGPRARDEPEPRLRRRARADDREATHDSLYDGTVEGLDYPELRARSVQFHPEAGPGPHDALADHRATGSRRCAVAAA